MRRLLSRQHWLSSTATSRAISNTTGRITATFSIIAIAAVLSACAAAQPAEGDTRRSIPALDVAAYMGTWHEIAHYPNRFQRQRNGDTTETPPPSTASMAPNELS